MSKHTPLFALVVLAVLPLAAHAASPRRVVSLADALAQADMNVPSLRIARAQSAVSAAQTDEARAPLLPQLNASASYQRTTSNFVPRPSSVPNTINTTASSSGSTFNYFNFGATLSQTLFDAPSFGRWRAALATLGSVKASEAAARLDAAYGTRVAFFNARATQALIRVARETYDNQKRHLDQVKGFVEVGTRPEIDLAQARTNVANAKVAFIMAENNYAVAKAQLNVAMGVEADTEYDLGDGVADPIDIEDAGITEQVDVAQKSRPELVAFEEQLHAQALVLRATRWSYAPTIGASTSLSDGGISLGALAWNWNFQVSAQWNLFGGLMTYSQGKEAQAQLSVITAQRDSQRLQVRLELERGRLAVRAAKETVLAAADALENATLREKLAEGRYAAGVGNALELSDAVLALANAGAQRIQADFNVATARSQLLRALGRR